MSDDNAQKRSLSEISHLFLSSVREKQTNGAPRPTRIPPGQARPLPMPELPLQSAAAPRGVDLTPEELAHVFGGITTTPIASTVAPIANAAAPITNAVAPIRRTPAVSAVLGAHLNGRQLDRAKE
ncbi:MAG TPA: hypothetical protein VG269_02565, partial [Tepidisphaeraceae bacterium]|nr:hypothetical protein [Tepidisphaeraceae bacterium]